jgi:hypothetical protein
MKKTLLLAFLLLSTGVLTLIPKDSINYLLSLGENQVITEEYQPEGVVYAVQLNQKFEALHSKLQGLLGYELSEINHLIDTPLQAGEVIDATTLNDKINAFKSAILTKNIGVTVPGILNENFIDGEIIESSILNQKIIALDNILESGSSLLQDKIVNNGQTWNVSAGTVNEYRDIIINSGGTVNISGSDITVFFASRSFVNNGNITGYANSRGDTKSYAGESYTDNRPQASHGGGDASRRGGNGNHGVTLIIKGNKSISGSGTFDFRGKNGGNGSDGGWYRSCSSGTLTACSNNGNYTCKITTSSCLLQSCTSGNSISSIQNMMKRYEFDINYEFMSTAHAFNIPPPCSQAKPNRIYRADGGGGAGGSGGYLWFDIESSQSSNVSSFNILLNGGSGGSRGGADGGAQNGASGTTGKFFINGVQQ